MSADFYAPFVALATEQIAAKGRACTLTRPARGGNPAKPWNSVQGDPAASAAQSIPVTAVFLSLERANLPESNVERRVQRVLIAADAAIPEQMGPDWKLTDAQAEWDVVSSQPLQPGGTLVMYTLEIAV